MPVLDLLDLALDVVHDIVKPSVLLLHVEVMIFIILDQVVFSFDFVAHEQLRQTLVPVVWLQVRIVQLAVLTVKILAHGVAVHVELLSVAAQLALDTVARVRVPLLIRLVFGEALPARWAVHLLATFGEGLVLVLKI